MCLWNTNAPIFSKTVTLIFDLDLDRWPWLWVLPQEYICETWKLYHLPFKNYGQYNNIKVFADKQTDKRTGQNRMPLIYRRWGGGGNIKSAGGGEHKKCREPLCKKVKFWNLDNGWAFISTECNPPVSLRLQRKILLIVSLSALRNRN